MTKDNHFQQYGYDHYLKSPKRPRDDSFNEEPRSRFRAGPGVMTLALLLTGAVFATVIVTSYPSGEGRRGEIPIVKADLRPVKTQPDNPGGMDIPNRDSTILARVGEAPIQGEREAIENLLESPDETMMSREEAIEAAMAEAEYRSPEEGAVFAEAPREVTPADVLQKIGEPAADAGVQSMALHEAGTSPETQDFVRNALEQARDTAAGDGKPLIEIKQAEVKEAVEPAVKNLAAAPSDTGLVSPSAPQSAPGEIKTAKAPVVAPQVRDEPDAAAASTIEPAAGMASPAPKIGAATGGYYVQLASVPNRAGTESEWKTLQKKFGSIIGGMKYRVQEVSLGARGTFYRIQAGPVSKEVADEICRDVKAASGGCLVVKK